MTNDEYLNFLKDDINVDMLISDNMWVDGFSLIDNAVIKDKRVSDNMFRVYCILQQMIGQNKAVAFPSMETLGSMIGSSDRTARRIIRELEKVDLVETIPRRGQSSLYKVKKWQNSKVLRDVEKIKESFIKSQNHGHIPEQPKEGIKKESPPKKDSDSKPDENELYKYIISYFNQQTGKKLHNVETNWKKIRTVRNKLKKEFGMDEKEILKTMKQVIDWKTIEWKDNPEMKNYLHPQTIFSSKFFRYMEQDGPITKKAWENKPTPKKKQTVDDIDWDNLLEG